MSDEKTCRTCVMYQDGYCNRDGMHADTTKPGYRNNSFEGDGMKYRYYLTQRPPSPGCQPSCGLVDVDFTTSKLNGHMVWGTVTYDRKLSQREIEAYELTEVSE